MDIGEVQIQRYQSALLASADLQDKLVGFAVQSL